MTDTTASADPTAHPTRILTFPAMTGFQLGVMKDFIVSLDTPLVGVVSVHVYVDHIDLEVLA